MRDQRRDEMSIVGPTHISNVPTTLPYTYNLKTSLSKVFSGSCDPRNLYLQFVSAFCCLSEIEMLLVNFIHIFIEFH